jgi:hypothetical protein
MDREYIRRFINVLQSTAKSLDKIAKTIDEIYFTLKGHNNENQIADSNRIKHGAKQSKNSSKRP